MTLFRKNRDAAKARRDQQAESGAVSDQTGVRRNQYGGMREGVRDRREKRAARVGERAADRFAKGKKLSKRQQNLADEHMYNVGRNDEITDYKSGKVASKAVGDRWENPKVEPQKQATETKGSTDTTESNVTKTRAKKVKNEESSKRAGHTVYYSDEQQRSNVIAKGNKRAVFNRTNKGNAKTGESFKYKDKNGVIRTLIKGGGTKKGTHKEV